MTTTATPARFEFECPDCHGSMIVDQSTQQALLTTGCVFCGSDLTTAVFDAE